MTYAQHAGRYHDCGLTPIPFERDGKAPCIRPPKRKLSLEAVERLADRFPDANLGVLCGERLSVVDVDRPEMLGEAVEVFGDSPLVANTPRGFHLWYAGGSWLQRKVGLMPGVDFLGSGFALAPPSKRDGANYSFLDGGLEDLDRLPQINRRALELLRPANDTETAQRLDSRAILDGGGPIPEGFRNECLFRAAKDWAYSMESLTGEALMDFLSRLHDDRCDPPWPSGEREREIQRVAQSVLNLWKTNRIIPRGGRCANIDIETHQALRGEPVAFSLLTYLKMHHPPEHTFRISTRGLEDKLGCSHPVVGKARDVLLNKGFIEALPTPDSQTVNYRLCRKRLNF